MPDRGDPDYDGLYKVRPLLETVRKNLIKNLTATELQSIDEQMISYKEGNLLKQHIKNNPQKWGICKIS